MKTQTPIDPKQAPGQQRTPHVQVYWRAVTYKTVLGYILVLILVVGGGVYLAKPGLYAAVIKKLTDQVSGPDGDALAADQKHAKFITIRTADLIG